MIGSSYNWPSGVLHPHYLVTFEAAGTESRLDNKMEQNCI